MAANYYYSRPKKLSYLPCTSLYKGDTTHRPGRIRYTIMEWTRLVCKQKCVNIRGEEIGPTLLETNSYGERIYGICTYPSETSCQVKPPIKSLFGHKREDSPTYS